MDSVHNLVDYSKFRIETNNDQDGSATTRVFVHEQRNHLTGPASMQRTPIAIGNTDRRAGSS